MKIKAETLTKVEFDLPSIRPGSNDGLIEQLIPQFVNWGRNEVSWPLVYALALSLLSVDPMGRSIQDIDRAMERIRDAVYQMNIPKG